MKSEKTLIMKLLGFMLVLILAMPFALAGCGGGGTAETGEGAESGTEVETSEDAGDVSGLLPEEVLDMDGPLVVIETEGIGNIARTVEGTPLEFDEEYPPNQIIDHLVKGKTLTIGAKESEDGWKFAKWTVNGEDYSTDEQTTITADEDLQIVAVFEFAD